MDISIIGTGFIGGTLGTALANAGHRVTFGSRHPEDDAVGEGTSAKVTSVAEALRSAEVVILALPAAGVPKISQTHSEQLAGKLVVDATNKMGAPAANSRSELPGTIRYARAFNTVGGENLANPLFDGQKADMFFSAPEGDQATLETIIDAVGLRPVYVGEDEEELIDGLFRLWIALAMKQGRGRRLAFCILGG